MKKIIIDNKEIEISEESFKALKDSLIVDENRRFKPKYDELYWYIDSNGEVDWCSWDDDEIDTFRYANHNIYKTEEEADRALEIRNILNKYSYDFTREELEDENLVKCSILVHPASRKLQINKNFSYFYGTRLFKTQEDCQKAIDEIGYEDYITYCIMGNIK